METSIDAASPGKPTDWHSIDWKLVGRSVGKMQTRIAQATTERDFRRAKRLQRNLIRSWQARALAVRKVTDNRGKKSSGVDGELWDTPEKKWNAVWSLNQGGYKARPLRRVYIPKANGKLRPLGIPTMLDRSMQALHQLALDPAAECASDPNSYGFRKGRSAHDARSQLFATLSQASSAQWILDADISGFFDHINHEWMLKHVHMDKRVLRKWLKAGVVDRGHLSPTEEGTPQGGIISPMLANIVLNGLEAGLKDFLEEEFGKTRAKGMKVNLVRYADDFLVTSNSKEVLETVVIPWVVQFLRERGLALAEEKTRVVHIDEGFDFLGWNFRKYRGKMLIKPSKKNVQALYSKVKEIIEKSLSVPTHVLIGQLNPVLAGWARYHQGVVAKETFSKLDNQIFWKLTRWGLRRHPRKTRKWVYHHYWDTTGSRWEFTGKSVNREGESVRINLYKLADTKIVRHTKVKGEYNPYHPDWFVYSEKLNVDRMSKDMWDTQRLKLWLSQAGKCALCEQELAYEDEWMHDHHIVHKAHGGSDALSNRVLLHPVCHRRVHNLGLFVTKPAS
jgi:RNA-directed DNA polymerase